MLGIMTPVCWGEREYGGGCKVGRCWEWGWLKISTHVGDNRAFLKGIPLYIRVTSRCWVLIVFVFLNNEIFNPTFGVLAESRLDGTCGVLLKGHSLQCRIL
jgi:hypothetical protein